MDFESLRTLLVDINGTLLDWDTTVLGAEDLVLEARERGIDVRFVTDNSLLNSEGWAERLRQNGIEAGKEDVITVCGSARRHLEKNSVRKAYVIGTEELHEQIKVRSSTDSSVVVAGFDRQFNYGKLERAAEILDNGELKVLSTQDYFSVGEDLKPHQGPMNRALSTFGEPENLGKPSEEFAQHVREQVSFVPETTLTLGDRIEDVKLGRKLGTRTALTMSGRTSREEVKKLSESEKPHLGVSNLPRLTRKL